MLNNTATELSLQRNTWLTCFLHRRLGMDVVNSLVTSALLVQSGHTWLPQTLVCLCHPPQSLILNIVSQSVYRTHPLVKGVLYKEFQCIHVKSFVVHMDCVNYHQETTSSSPPPSFYKLCCD